MSFSHLLLFASDLYAHTNSPLTPRGFEKPSPFNLRCFRVSQHHIYWHASVTIFKRVINPSRKGSLKRKNIFFFRHFDFCDGPGTRSSLQASKTKIFSFISSSRTIILSNYRWLTLLKTFESSEGKKIELWLKRLTSGNVMFRRRTHLIPALDRACFSGYRTYNRQVIVQCWYKFIPLFC